MNTITTIRELATRLYGEDNFAIDKDYIGKGRNMRAVYSLDSKHYHSCKILCDKLRHVLQVTGK
jgi:hypothetical protein